MRIAIATDSRGSQGEDPWVGQLVRNNPKYNTFISLNFVQAFTTLFLHVPEIVKSSKVDGIFDIGIIQLGYHEYVIPWIMTCWNHIAKIDPNYKEHLTPCPLIEIKDGGAILHTFKNTYYYRHDESIKKCFDILHQVCKKIIFITMPYCFKQLEKKVQMMNGVFSSYADRQIILPQDPEFPRYNTIFTGADRVHYTSTYNTKLCKMVELLLSELLVNS